MAGRSRRNIKLSGERGGKFWVHSYLLAEARRDMVVIIKSAPGVVVSVIRLRVANVHAPFL